MRNKYKLTFDLGLKGDEDEDEGEDDEEDEEGEEDGSDGTESN